MTAEEWAKIKHFRPNEFDSPDAYGSGFANMKIEIVSVLDYIRTQCGFPLIINSGYRTVAHNALVDGVHSSSHTEGYAADIACRTGKYRYSILYYAHEIGVHRMGVGQHIIHLDVSPTLPQNVVWLY